MAAKFSHHIRTVGLLLAAKMLPSRRTTRITELRQVMRPFQKRTDRNFGACDCYATLSCVT
jgi:hypothetical protein